MTWEPEIDPTRPFDWWLHFPWRTTCGGCGWPLQWAWHVTVSGQQCRNCQLQLPRETTRRGAGRSEVAARRSDRAVSTNYRREMTEDAVA